MPHMEMQVTNKGTIVAVDCPHCWHTTESHEAMWEPDINLLREAHASGNLVCPECFKGIPASAHMFEYRGYAARYSADGYLDCTPWVFGTNRRALIRDVREIYGPSHSGETNMRYHVEVFRNVSFAVPHMECQFTSGVFACQWAADFTSIRPERVVTVTDTWRNIVYCYRNGVQAGTPFTIPNLPI